MGVKVSLDLLKRLARLSETDRTILSVYLSLKDGWKKAEDFIGKESMKKIPLLSRKEIDYFETSVSFLSDFLKEEKDEGFSGPGLAFFVDLGADYSAGVELTVPPEPMLAVDDEAIIHPLALELDEYEPVGVIMIDAACTRIQITAGQVSEDMTSFCEKIHHQSKKGGWSQMRYQRRRDKEIKHFVKGVVLKAVEIFKDAHVNRILLAGRDRMITRVENELPKEWQDRVIGALRWDLADSKEDFIERIRPVLEEAERNQEKDLLARMISELRRGGLAASGTEDVREALRIGQVDTLIVSEGLDLKIMEELTSLAEASGAYVEFIPKENFILEKLGGVGAILRYKLGK